MPFPARVPAVTIYAGDDYEFPSYQFFEDDSETPINLSAYAWAAQWRTEPSATTAVDLTVDATGAATGAIQISISGELTADLAASGVWDLQSTLAGVTRTWIHGAIYCQKDVTRG